MGDFINAQGYGIAFIVIAIVGSVLWARRFKKKQTVEHNGGLQYVGNIFSENAQTNATPAQTSASGESAKPQVDFSHVDRLTLQKTMQIVEKDQGSHISGFIVTLGYNGVTHVAIDRGAVRWLKDREFWNLMHPTQYTTEEPAHWTDVHRVAADLGVPITSEITPDQHAAYLNLADRKAVLSALGFNPARAMDEDQLQLDFGGTASHLRQVSVSDDDLINQKVAYFLLHLEAHLIHDIRELVAQLESGRRYFTSPPPGIEQIAALVRAGYHEIQDLVVMQGSAK
jgi:hypothetical protein